MLELITAVVHPLGGKLALASVNLFGIATTTCIWGVTLSLFKERKLRAPSPHAGLRGTIYRDKNPKSYWFHFILIMTVMPALSIIFLVMAIQILLLK